MKLIFLLCLVTIALGSGISEANSTQKSDESKNYLYKGWLKFFSYMPNTKTGTSPPTKFEYNQAYYNQYVGGKNVSFDPNKDRDQYGWYDINDVAKTVKSLEMDWLSDIEEDQSRGGLKGGVQDLGNSNGEFCFRLSSKTGIFWDLCADSLLEKQNWFEQFKTFAKASSSAASNRKSAILPSQEVNLPFDFPSNPKPPLPEKGQDDKLIAKNGAKTDGRWVILQDWSQCSLACGGGKQYLQRMCIPPQNGGNPCSGPSVMEKTCNTHPCPNIITHQASQIETLPTIVKMQQISNRLQRFEICVIKEGDLDLLLRLPNLERSPRIPVRVVLNNKTVTVFTTPSFDSVYKSFDLPYTVLRLSDEDPNSCFVIQDQRDAVNKRVDLCVLPLGLRPSESIASARDKWIEDIRFFKEKCGEKDKYVNLDIPEIQRKKMEVEIEETEEKYQRVKERAEEQKEKSLAHSVEKTSQMAMKAVEKELKYEQLAIKEEMQREQVEEAEMAKELENEKEKQQCLERELKKKEKMKQLEKQTLEIADKIQSIQKAAVIQVQQGRSKTLEKIAAMKRQSERRRRESKRQIQEIRTKIASELLKEEHVGNATHCNPNRPVSDIKKYCTENLKDEPQKQTDCLMGGLDFCYSCCEFEFGRMFEDQRESCYGSCETSKPVSNAENQKGLWTFVPEANKLNPPGTNSFLH